MLGVTIPKDFTGVTTSEGEGEPDVVNPISWYYPHVFHSYPKAYPRVTFQDPVIRDGLYYTSGMESFISTMETNALMGMNVARLIVDGILGSQDGDAGTSTARLDPSQEGDQRVIGKAVPQHESEEL